MLSWRGVATSLVVQIVMANTRIEQDKIDCMHLSAKNCECLDLANALREVEDLAGVSTTGHS